MFKRYAHSSIKLKIEFDFVNDSAHNRDFAFLNGAIAMIANFFLMSMLLFISLGAKVDWETFPAGDKIETDEPEEQIFSKGLDFSSAEGEEDPLDVEPSAVVSGAVNVITGRYQTSDCDFILSGAEPFALRRVYSSGYFKKDEEGPIGKGWHRNYFTSMKYWTDDKMKMPYYALLREDFGITYLYRSENHRDFFLSSDCYEKAATNCSNGVISAHTNVHNNHLFRLKSDSKYTFKAASGSELTLAPVESNKHLLMTKEMLVNGNSRSYKYDSKHRPSLIETFDRNKQAIGHLQFTYGTSAGGQKVGLISSQGNILVRYSFVELKGKKSEKSLYLAEAIRQQAPTVCYTYEDHHDDAKYVNLRRKTLPNGRFEEIEYYRKGMNEVGSSRVYIKEEDDLRIARVKLQKAPVGTDSTPIITQRYFYIPRDKDSIGEATVLDALNHRTDYLWNQNDRLKTIIKYTGIDLHTLHSKEKLYWNSASFKRCIFLNARTLEDQAGKIHFVRGFEYDGKGNVLEDTLWGNLSGDNQIPCTEPVDDYAESNGTECYTNYYTYSDDGLNLVTSHCVDNNCDHFFYYPGTNLLKTKLYTHKEKIYKREYYEYDASGMVTKEFVDDGCSEDIFDISAVTERRIKYIKRQQYAPFGLPIAIDETNLAPKGTKDILLRKTLLKYDEQGRITRKDVYGADEAYLYSLHWEYDERGNITKEVDALGYATIRRYDENNNKIYERGPSPKYHTKYTYDYADRLVSTTEYHQDGINLTQVYKYDYLGNKIASSDVCGNEVLYTYDDFGRVSHVTSPLIEDGKGNVHSIVESKEYDILGYETKTVDGRGNVTTQANTIRGKPYVIEHPDGTKDLFKYYRNGLLKRHIEPTGNYTRYKYDCQQRLVHEIYFSAKGETLWQKSNSYSAFHLLSETDPAGVTKFYSYDGAGRVVETTQGHSRTTYEYDAAGHTHKVIEWDGQGSGIAKVQLYDVMDRVIEERIEDIAGRVISKVCYKYDVEGQKIATITYSDQGELIERTTYDSRHQPTRTINAAGKSTRAVYRYDYRNSLGQIVPYCEITDPEGNIAITIKDALGRLQMTQSKNRFGELLEQQILFYDGNGNKVSQQQLHIKNSSKDRRVDIEWCYDSMNRLTAMHEAVERSKTKTTMVQYNAYGQKEKVTKPDGIALKHAYDTWGRLSSLEASDKSFAYQYTYDANDNILSIQNSVDDTATIMKYDRNNRPIEETLANGLRVKYVYDGLGQPLEVTLPDKSGMRHIYHASQLVEVQRWDRQGKLRYKHSYDSFDLQGKITGMTLVGKGGKASYIYDGMGRATSIKYGAWRESIRYDNVGNVVSTSTDNGLKITSARYRYDDLYRLVEEQSEKKHSYLYDSLGNRTEKDGKKYSINCLNELLSDTDQTYVYDLNGNPIEIHCQDGVTTFKYDTLDRLLQASCGDERVVYTYDAQHRRMSKKTLRKDPSSKQWKTQSDIRFLYLGQNEVGSFDADGVPLELRILGHGKGAEIGAAVAMEIKGHLYAPLHNQAGNVTALVDAETGQIAETYRYTAFGGHYIFDNLGNALEKSLSPWLYSSKRYDAEMGLVYFGRRYYKPETGRWLTTDPIAFAGGLNLYAYCKNNPLRYNDHYGLFALPNRPYHPISTPIGRFVSSTSHQIARLVSLPGRIIEFVGFHVVPLPIVRDLIQIGGRVLSGQSLADYKWDWEHSSKWDHLHRPEPANGDGLATGNGMCTSRDDIRQRAIKKSDALGGANVHYFHNSTHGFIPDLLESICQKIGIKTRSQTLFNEGLKELTLSKTQANPNARIHLDTHSQGGIMADNAQFAISSTLCEHIDVNTFGTARIIVPGHFGKVKNYISIGDGVPLTDPIRYAKAVVFGGDHVVFLETNSFPLIDHPWDNKTYQNAIKMTYRDINANLIGAK